MTDTTSAAPSAPAPESKGVVARFFGIIFSPRATYADVAARPRWIAMFLTVAAVTAALSAALMSTEIGRRAVVDQQISQSEAFGRTPTDAQIDMFEKISAYYVYIAPAGALVGLAIGALVVAGLAFAVFSAFLGGETTFKQTFAVVVHSGVILAATAFLTTPLAYVRETVSSATNLAVFAPFLDETSFAARALGSINLVYVWWMLSLAIGLGVLNRKRTAPIATTLLAVYVVIGLIIAAIRTATTGV